MTRWTWKHALALFVGLDGLAFTLPLVVAPIARALGRPATAAPPGAQREEYDELVLPRFAPPGWAFPVAWTTNRALGTAAIARVANRPAGTPGRAGFLATQAAFWSIYVLFNPLYFTLRSPVNGAVLTAASAALHLAAVGLAGRLRDPALVAGLLPTAAWLGVALPLSLSVARDNPDTLWGTRGRRATLPDVIDAEPASLPA